MENMEITEIIRGKAIIFEIPLVFSVISGFSVVLLSQPSVV
jgi:hypothetical protein